MRFELLLDVLRRHDDFEPKLEAMVELRREIHTSLEVAKAANRLPDLLFLDIALETVNLILLRKQGRCVLTSSPRAEPPYRTSVLF